MDVKKLELLASLRVEQRAIEARIDEIMPEIVVAASELDSGTQLEVSIGRFIISKRRVWKYPANVKKLETAFKDAKKEAEQTGEADYTENTSLLFKTSDDPTEE